MMNCGSTIFGALKAQYIPAQGTALGNEIKIKLSPERARQKHGVAGYDYVTPLQGSNGGGDRSLGRCPRLVCNAPLGLGLKNKVNQESFC